MANRETATTAAPGALDVSTGLTGRTLTAAAVGVFCAEFTLTTPAGLTGLYQFDFGPTSAQLLWMGEAFLLPVTLLELTFGVIGDLFGRKRLLVGGSVLMVVGLVIAVLTPGLGTGTDARIAVLMGGEILAGIGAAAIIPTTLIMVAAGTHTMADRSRGLAIWSVALTVSAVVAPVSGGWFSHYGWGRDPHASWRWALVACIVVVLIGLVLSVRADDSSDPVGRSLDWPGQITIALSLLGLLVGVIQGSASGWGSPTAVAGFAAAAVFMAAFVLAELRSSAPVLQLRLFRRRPFAAAQAANLFGMFSYLATSVVLSIRLTAVQGHTALYGSIAFAVMNGMAFVLYPVLQKALATVNPRWVLGVGLALLAIGNFWLSTISIDSMSVAPLIIPLVIAGAGTALSISSVAAVTVNAVPRHMLGMAGGTNSMIRDLGFTLAPAVIGAIALSRASRSIASAVASNPALGTAVNAFYAAPAHALAAEQAQLAAAVGAVKSGPLGANGVPAAVPGPGGKLIPFNPLHETAFHALGSSYSLAFLISGIFALVAAVITVALIGGGSRDTSIEQESLA